MLKWFMYVMAFHWVEHAAQAFQVYVLHWHRPHAGGFLGLIFPWLVHSEALHFGYAALMLAMMIWIAVEEKDLAVGTPGSGWFTLALGIQSFHFIEHTKLLADRFNHIAVPVSFVQTLFPTMRIELHLFYNTIVTIPVLIALWRRHAANTDLGCGRGKSPYSHVQATR